MSDYDWGWNNEQTVSSTHSCENASEITRKSNAMDLISREDAIELFEKYSYPIEPDMGSVERGMTLYGIKQVLEEVPSAERKGKWIPCSERLPEEYGDYLVTKRGIQWNCEPYDVIDIAYYADKWHKADTVIAWMPLPEPYTEIMFYPQAEGITPTVAKTWKGEQNE